MHAASLLLVAVLAQPVEHRVEVLGRGGSVFWSAGGDLWERMRGEVVLDARRSPEGPPSAQLTAHVTRNAERWTVELSGLGPGGMLIDSDLPGPGGLIHAAAAIEGTARVTRAGVVLAAAAPLRVVALTTGFHADDETFRTLPAGRTGDLELLIHVDGLPGIGPLELGFEHPEIRVDGNPVPAAAMADAMAPQWPGAHAPSGVGGSGAPSMLVLGPVPALPSEPPRAASAAPPSSPEPANAQPAGPLPSSPEPANALPATGLPPSPGPANALPATGLPPSPEPANAQPASPLPGAPTPGNAAPALPVPASPTPANAAPAVPLPATPTPGNAPSLPAMPAPPSSAPNTPVPSPPGVVPAPPSLPHGEPHGEADEREPKWFPLPPSPVPGAPPHEDSAERFAARGSKIDPSGQASTVRLRVHLRARNFDPSRHLPRVALANSR